MAATSGTQKVDLLDRDAINLTAGAGFVGCSRPTWSPDGSAIAFAAATRSMDGDYELYTVAVPLDPQTPPTPRRLTDNALDDLSPDWDPPTQTPQPSPTIFPDNPACHTQLPGGGGPDPCMPVSPLRLVQDDCTAINSSPDRSVMISPTTDVVDNGRRLEEAISCINRLSDRYTQPFTIFLEGGEYRLEGTFEDQTIPIDSFLVIYNTAAAPAILRPITDGAFTPFYIAEGAVVEMYNLQIQGGGSGLRPYADYSGSERYGGGIFNHGWLSIFDSVFVANEALTGGGGIANWGVLNLQRTVFGGNHADYGGAIFQAAGGQHLTQVVVEYSIM